MSSWREQWPKPLSVSASQYLGVPVGVWRSGSSLHGAALSLPGLPQHSRHAAMKRGASSGPDSPTSVLEVNGWFLASLTEFTLVQT